MLTGNVYQLATPTLAILTDNKKRIPVTVPSDACLVIRSVDGPMADVEWNGRVVTVFVVDIQVRGNRVSSACT